MPCKCLKGAFLTLGLLLAAACVYRSSGVEKDRRMADECMAEDAHSALQDMETESWWNFLMSFSITNIVIVSLTLLSTTLAFILFKRLLQSKIGPKIKQNLSVLLCITGVGAFLAFSLLPTILLAVAVVALKLALKLPNFVAVGLLCLSAIPLYITPKLMIILSLTGSTACLIFSLIALPYVVKVIHAFIKIMERYRQKKAVSKTNLPHRAILEHGSKRYVALGGCLFVVRDQKLVPVLGGQMLLFILGQMFLVRDGKTYRLQGWKLMLPRALPRTPTSPQQQETETQEAQPEEANQEPSIPVTTTAL